MNEKRFQRKIEDFVCKNCQKEVKGDGYTNHCPFCLWSMHVDINPGDRKEQCRGMMKPVGVKVYTSKYIIYYQCTKCGFKHKVKARNNDNIDKIIQLSLEKI